MDAHGVVGLPPRVHHGQHLRSLLLQFLKIGKGGSVILSGSLCREGDIGEGEDEVADEDEEEEDEGEFGGGRWLGVLSALGVLDGGVLAWVC